MIETLKTLCALSGVSSFEDEVRDYIKGRVAPMPMMFGWTPWAT